MPNLNGTGPEKKGSGTGRKLGSCKKEDTINETENDFQLGKGLGKKRKSRGGNGKGKRMKTYRR